MSARQPQPPKTWKQLPIAQKIRYWSAGALTVLGIAAHVLGQVYHKDVQTVINSTWISLGMPTFLILMGLAIAFLPMMLDSWRGNR